MWLRSGSTTAFVAAAVVLLAAVAGGITEPSGRAAVVAVIAAVVAYGITPLLVAVAMRQSGLSSWWSVAAAALATTLWSAVGLLLVAPALAASALTLTAALVSAAPSASALWVLAASVEVVRAGMHRWSLVFVAAFVAVLIVGNVFIELSGFDIRRVLVPLGWAVWMVDIGRAMRSRLSPVVEPRHAVTAEPACAKCGAPRRSDGLAFCSACGLPYGMSEMTSQNSPRA